MVLFDADGTLFNYDECERQALTKTIQQIGVQYDERFLAEYKRINSAIWMDREQGKIDVERLKIKRFELLFEAVKISHDPKSFSDRYLENLAEEAELLDNAEEVIQKLSRNYKLALVTNGLKEVQRRRLKKSSLNRYFDQVIVSDEIGASKPDEKFFEITFAKMGNPVKDKVMIIGDSLSSDIQGANKFRIDACWYNPMKKKRAPGLEIKYEIGGLLELVEMLCST